MFSIQRLIEHYARTFVRLPDRMNIRFFGTRAVVHSEYLPKVVVCGFPNGGTTLLLQLLLNTGMYSSNFECGFLLAKTPSDFRTNTFFKKVVRNTWKVTEEEIDTICEAEDHNEMYRRLMQLSRKFDESKILIDKTPVYLDYLSSVLQRNPTAKYLAIVRNPCPLINSWLKRGDFVITKDAIERMIHRYMRHHAEYKAVISGPAKDKVLLIHHEELCIFPERVCKGICTFLDIPFNDSMLDLREKNFRNIHNGSIGTAFINEYKKTLPPEVQQRIVQKTAAAKEFLYDVDAALQQVT